MIELDYEVQGTSIRDGGRIRPILPSLGMPCLSFSWQLITPPRWEISGQSTGLLSGDPCRARLAAGRTGYASTALARSAARNTPGERGNAPPPR